MFAKYIEKINWPDLFTTLRVTVLNSARKMAGFFILTEEERAQAGIYTGGEGREK